MPERDEVLRYLRNSVILLGIVNILFGLFFVVVGYLYVQSIKDNQEQFKVSQQQLQCSVDLLAGPWIGLKSQLEAPIGDPTARQKAVERIAKAIHRMESSADICTS